MAVSLIVGLVPACLCSNWPHWTPKLVWALTPEPSRTRACPHVVKEEEEEQVRSGALRLIFAAIFHISLF